MERCKVCRKKPRIERRVNNEGIVFCSDECYEEFEDSPNDHDHPYIDDYEALRFEYIHLMHNYEGNLYEACIKDQVRSIKVELLELIDSLMSEFSQYYGLEGLDGVFSKELYHYLLDLEELYSVIENWEPDKRELKKYQKAWG